MTADDTSSATDQAKSAGNSNDAPDKSDDSAMNAAESADVSKSSSSRPVKPEADAGGDPATSVAENAVEPALSPSLVSSGSTLTYKPIMEVVFESTADPEAIAAVAGGYHATPFDILGLHALPMASAPGLVVRTIQPQARCVSVVRSGTEYAMKRVHSDGVFEAVFPGETEFFRYELSISLPDGRTYLIEDPYRFPPLLTEFDLHLFSEGNHFQLYDKLGAHLVVLEGVAGVHF